jgi:hypothetical protein
MLQSHRRIVLVVALLGLGIGPTRAAKAGTYTFTGTITSVDDPFGAFSSLAALGAPVSGTFAYSDSASYYASSFVPSVTVYSNERSDRPELTRVELNINGVGQRSDDRAADHRRQQHGPRAGDQRLPGRHHRPDKRG